MRVKVCVNAREDISLCTLMLHILTRELDNYLKIKMMKIRSKQREKNINNNLDLPLRHNLEHWGFYEANVFELRLHNREH
jgi:hypothetical protein